MKKFYYPNAKMFVFNSFMLLAFIASSLVNAQVSLLSETLVTDEALYFDGTKNTSSTNTDVNAGYDYAYGRPINPHGDCIKTYKDYVFMTWYRGGKEDRHVMLTRYNIATGAKKTIEFPHQHTGFDGKWWIGETHNTIAIGICPINGTIHLAYDMHAYGNAGAFTNDYLRYSYSVSNLADMTDDEFTLDKFVKDPLDGDYKHTTMNGVLNVGNFSRLSYPKFFLNTEGELFLCMRRGTSHDGNMVFIKYDETASKWGSFKDVTAMGAQSKGETDDWSIYGNMKFSAGKMRLGFQRRLHNGSDKYVYQNGVYYAYCDDPTGASQWKNYKGEPMTFPLVKAGEVLIMEPGDYVETTQRNMVHIVDGFDFEVTDRGDEHIVSKVTDKENNVQKLLHTYRKAGDSEFTTEEYNAGSELYAAGNDIYVIGLKNGRVNIVKTEGGTSNFRQIYQQTTGPTFDKGIVYISEGKLYYYLKEIAGTGAKRSTYLQVFDLDIDTTPADTSRVLSFKNIFNNQEIELGGNLTIQATVGSAFKSVTLWSDAINLGTLSEAPFTWSGHTVLTNMRTPEYHFTLKALDSANVLTEKSITLYTPEDPTLKVSFISPTNGDIFGIGDVLNVEAKLGSALTEVSLWLGDTNMGTLTSAPYKWELSDLPKASHQLKLIASNGEGTITMDSIKVSVFDYIFEGKSFGTPDALCRAGENVATLFDGDLKTALNTQAEAKNNAWAGIDYGAGVQKRIVGLRFALRVPDDLANVSIMKSRLQGTKIYGANTVTWDESGQTNDVTADMDGNLIYEISADDVADANLEELIEVSVAANTDKAFRYVLVFFSEGSFGNCAEFGVYTEDLVNSINETISSNSIKIYPVPVSQTLNIKGVDGVRAVVYDILGKTVKTEALYNDQLNVASMKSGMYILQIEDKNNNQHILRFTKH